MDYSLGNYSRDFCCLSFCLALSSPPLLSLPSLVNSPTWPGLRIPSFDEAVSAFFFLFLFLFLFFWLGTNGSVNRQHGRERGRARERKEAGGEGEWPSWHEENNEKEFCYLLPFLHRSSVASHPTPILRCVSSLCLFLNLPVTLYLPNSGFASVGLQLITGVITHILDDLIGEKAYKSS